MSIPVVKYNQGNFDKATQKPTIIFELHNAGAGPTTLKNLEFTYPKKTHPNSDTLLNACCFEEEKKLHKAISELKKEGKNTLFEQSGLNKIILEQAITPSQSSLKLSTLQRTAVNDRLWEKLDMLRNNIEVEACFCPPLGDYYESKEVQISSIVNIVPMIKNKKHYLTYTRGAD